MPGVKIPPLCARPKTEKKRGKKTKKEKKGEGNKTNTERSLHHRETNKEGSSTCHSAREVSSSALSCLAFFLSVIRAIPEIPEKIGERVIRAATPLSSAVIRCHNDR